MTAQPDFVRTLASGADPTDDKLYVQQRSVASGLPIFDKRIQLRAPDGRVLHPATHLFVFVANASNRCLPRFNYPHSS